MTQMEIFRFPNFDGIEVHIPSDYEQLEQFGLSVMECLKQIRRLPTGDILLNQIKFAVPLAVSPAIAENPEIRNLRFDISVNVIIMPIVVRYMQGGYREVFGEMVESSHPGHNPSRGAFWRRAGSGAQTEALDNDAASKPGIGSKAVVRFSNAQMSNSLETPPFIVLAHELIHAVHHLYGVRWDGQEEDRTTGTGNFDGGRSGRGPGIRPLLSENELRREARLPIRRSY
jgi:hypothetical protein